MNFIRKVSKIFLSIIFGYIFLLSSLLLAQEITKITLIQDPWPPYTFGKAGEIPSRGFAVEISKEIFQRLNIQTDLMLFPWKRCLLQLKLGEKDGIMLLTKNTERQEYMDFTDKLMDSQDMIWYYPEKFKAHVGKEFSWDTFRDLKPYKIGHTAGFNYGERYDEAVREHNLIEEYANTDEQNFKKLFRGRIDIFVCNDNAAYEVFNIHPELKGKFKFAKKPLQRVEYFMAFSKKSPARSLLPQINHIIAQMKNDGTINKLIVAKKE